MITSRTLPPPVRRFLTIPASTLAATAGLLLAVLWGNSGAAQTATDDLAALDPFIPAVRQDLWRSKSRVNLGARHGPTEAVKSAIRKRLREEPDPRLAWTLALIIQDQLSGTALMWAAPTDSSHGQGARENPDESHETLAQVLEFGLGNAKADDPLRRHFGLALAKLRLLQGNWEAMNAALRKIGDDPIPAEQRPSLPAPPTDWSKGVRNDWKLCDESWRTGECGLIVHVEKDGRGLKGVHVLLKETPPKSNVFRTGIRADTLFLAPVPVDDDRGMGSFGYLGPDRVKTRYAVSDDSGEVRFDRLPDMEVTIEVLVPTANFTERGWAWDLYMETEPGKFQLARIYGSERIDPNEEPAVVQLERGKTVRYPRLVVRPRLRLEHQNWTQATPAGFVAKWEDVRSGPDDPLRYELAMSMTGPPETPDSPEFAKAIRTATQPVPGNTWPVGEKGVADMRLQPGGIYVLQVVARDAAGKQFARSDPRFIWVPWDHRKTDPPVKEHDTYRQSPIKTDTWHRGSYDYGDGRKEDLPQKVARFLSDYLNAFEREYVQVGKAWLMWWNGEEEAAAEELRRLARELPKGSVPQATAAWLLAEDEASRPFPKRLELKAPPEEVDSSTRPAEGEAAETGPAAPTAPSRVFIGSVRDADGRAVAGAEIRWSPYWQCTAEDEITRTDADGRYRLVVTLLDPNHVLSAAAPGFAPGGPLESVPGPADRPTGVSFTLDPGHWLAGRVSAPDGKALAGAKLEVLTPRRGFYSSFSTVIDPRSVPGYASPVVVGADGAFRLESLPAEKVVLRVKHPDYEQSEREYTVDSEHEIVLGKARRPDGVIWGVVIDPETDEPIRSFTVDLSNGRSREFSTEDGRFEWDRLWGYRFRVMVAAEGHRPLVQKIEARPKREARSIVFALPRGEPLRVEVVDAGTGKPVEHASIWYGMRDRLRSLDWKEFTLGGERRRMLGERSGTTGSGGVFSVPEGAVPGMLCIWADGYARRILRPDDRPPLTPDGRLRIELSPEATIAGVLSLRGKPRTAERVSIGRHPDEHAIEQEFEPATTDGDGRFEFHALPAGRYWIAGGGLTRSLDLAEGEQAFIDLGGDLGICTLEGRVEPWTDLRLRPRFEWDYSIISTRADVDGRFRMDGLQPGKYHLSLHRFSPTTGMFIRSNREVEVRDHTTLDPPAK